MPDPPPTQRLSPVALARFVRAHAWCLLVAPVVGLWATTVHEAAHALAAVAQGGELTSFRVLPHQLDGRFVWGAIHYDGVPGMDHDLVSLAPALLSVATLVLVTPALRLTKGRLRTLVFLLGWLLPMVDLSLSASGLFLGVEGSDWHKALDGAEGFVGVGGTLLAVGGLTLGWNGFRTLPRADLSILEFLAGFVVLAGWPWVALI